ncbi:MAG TPA: hypothetical protein VF610_12020 [Segetibacter sp.]
MASLLQRDSTRLFLKLLRMFQNAFASLSSQPADVPYAITGVSGGIFKNKLLSCHAFKSLNKKRTDLIKKALRKLSGQSLRLEQHRDP